MDLAAMIAPALEGRSISRDDARAILAAPASEMLAIVTAAGQVRRQFFGRRVKLNYLVSLRSGMCPEDCSYCSQAKSADTGILRYSWQDKDTTLQAARAGLAGGARRVCLVASGHGPSNREVEHVANIITGIKEENPQVEVCACLGFIDEAKARRLHEAGADAYNHNLNTAESHYEDICTTHTYADRQETVGAAKAGGMSACCGLIAGMGETDEELLDVLYALRDLDVDSVPVNFLLPFEGTPLQSHKELTPQRCLVILSLARLIHPDREVRCAAGREYHLGSLQPLALEVANSIFLGDYLTSEGQAGSKDLRMIRDLGFEVEGAAPGWLDEVLSGDVHAAGAPAPTEGGSCGGHGSCGGRSACGGCDHATDGEVAGEPVAAYAGAYAAEGAESPAIRRRGVGTDLQPNA